MPVESDLWTRPAEPAGLVTVGGRRMYRPATQRDSRALRIARVVQGIGLLIFVAGAIADLASGKADIIVLVLAALAVALSVPGMIARRRNPPPTEPVAISDALVGEVQAFYAEDDRLNAVKRVREETGLGLRDSIAAADAIADRAGTAVPR